MSTTIVTLYEDAGKQNVILPRTKVSAVSNENGLGLDAILDGKLSLTGGNMSGHVYLTGSKESSSTGNTSQLIFGTSNTQHVAISSNDNALVINPTSSSTTNQIVLYLNQASVFPNGISGNASTATKLQTARTVRTNLASTSTASFDGSANITPGVTGTLPIGNGGTGATKWEDALTNLNIKRLFCSMVPYGTTIPASANLNTTTYLKVGNYFCASNANAGTLTNSPVTEAFMMQVYTPLSTTFDNETTGTWVYRIRKLMTYTGHEYIQYCYAGATANSWTYGAWSKTARTSDITLSTLGVTATAAELNILDGITATTAELNYVDGVTSNIQTQLNGKQASITGGATTITSSNLTASRALVSDSNGKVAVSAVTSTELGYLDGVTSAIQTQLDNKMSSRPACIELGGSADSVVNEGFIDFHFNNSSADYTSRIIESASGTLEVNSVAMSGGAITASSTITGNRLIVSNTSGVKHLEFKRTNNPVYICSNTSSNIHFVTNAKAVGDANTDFKVADGGKIYKGNGKNMPAVFISSSTPTALQTGDIWFVT